MKCKCRVKWSCSEIRYYFLFIDHHIWTLVSDVFPLKGLADISWKGTRIRREFLFLTSASDHTETRETKHDERKSAEKAFYQLSDSITTIFNIVLDFYVKFWWRGWWINFPYHCRIQYLRNHFQSREIFHIVQTATCGRAAKSDFAFSFYGRLTEMSQPFCVMNHLGPQ